LPKNKCAKILVYCLSGKRSAIESKMLVDSGYKRVDNIQVGITAWVNTGYSVVVNLILGQLIILRWDNNI
jgi:rhodanese-related sulfurtransferase